MTRERGNILLEVVCTCGRVVPLASAGGIYVRDPPTVRRATRYDAEPVAILRCPGCAARLLVYSPPGGTPHAERMPRGAKAPRPPVPTVRWCRKD